jgi:hypothetical protein
MSKLLEWLKSNKALVTVILSIVAGFSSGYVKVTKDPNATQPTVIIVVPEENAGPVAFGGPISDRLGLLKIRVHAATELAKAKNVDWVKAFRATQKVSADDIAACALKAGCPVEDIGDGQFIKRIVEWFLDPANQEKIMKFIAFVMQMAALFL